MIGKYEKYCTNIYRYITKICILLRRGIPEVFKFFDANFFGDSRGQKIYTCRHGGRRQVRQLEGCAIKPKFRIKI